MMYKYMVACLPACRQGCLAGFFVILLSGCHTASRISNQNYSYLYRKEFTVLHPRWIVYHVNDSVSRLYVSVDSRELLFSRAAAGEEFTAEYRISYRAFPDAESKEVIDSGSVQCIHASEKNMNLRQDEGIDLIAYAALKLKRPVKCILEVTVTDVKRNQSATTLMTVEKENRFSGQHFLIRKRGSSDPLFRNYMLTGEEIEIHCPPGTPPRLTVHCYNRKFPLPPPPFSVYNPAPFDYVPDSIFTLMVDSNRNASVRSLPQGFYHFLADTQWRDGLTLYRFQDDFPKVTMADQLLESVRYFTTRQEYNDLMLLANKKAALDDFWVKTAGSHERARLLIKSYYSRVQEANEFFTSHTEGWKTDRGMIYIIFGPPDAVYRTSNTESWVYGEEGSFLSFNFLFVRVKNPFSSNDYQLQRTPIYKNTWYRAVEAWRQGVVY